MPVTIDTRAGELSGGTPHVVSPFTGEILESSDHEGLLDMYATAINAANLAAKMLMDINDTDTQISFVELLKEQSDHNWTQRATVSQKLSDKTVGETKTRRVAGQKRVCKIEMPSETWDGKALKYLWESQPEQSRKFLRIASIDPQMREVKKLETMACEGELKTFRDILFAARRAPTGTPRVTVEK